jgi:predicted MFS family arabinose efflux permease
MKNGNNLKRGESGYNSAWAVALLAALFAHFANAVPHFGIYPIIAMIRDNLSLSATETSTFTGIAGIASILAVLPAAFLYGRLKLKYVAAAALVLSTAGMVVLLLAKSFLAAVIGRFLWMFFYRAALVGCVSLAIAASPPSFKGRAMGLNGTAACIGAAVAAPVVSYIAVNYKWNSIFYLFIAVVILGAFVTLVWFKPYELSGGDNDAPKEDAQKVNILTNPLVWAAVLVMFLFSSGYGTIQLISLLLKDIFNAGPSTAVMAQSIGQVLGIFFIPVFGVIMDRLGNFHTLLIVAVCQFIIYAGMASGFFPLFVVCCAALQFMAICGLNMVYATAPGLLSGFKVGSVSSIITLGTGIAQFLLPYLAARVYVRNGNYFWYFMVLLTMAALAMAVSGVFIAKTGRNRQFTPEKSADT